MVPAATALAQTAAAREAAHGLLLSAARRDHEQHALRRRDESLDARRRRPRLRLEADPRAVRAAEEIPDGRQRSRQQARRELRRARDRAGHVAVVPSIRARATRRSAASRSTRSRRATSARKRRCRRSRSRPRRKAAAPRATARTAAATAARSRSARRRRRCRWSSSRARRSRRSSAAARATASAAPCRGDYRACSTWCSAKRTTLKRTLGGEDRALVDDYLDSVREIERRVRAARASAISRRSTCPTCRSRGRASTSCCACMFDLIVAAFQANMTRIASFMMAAEVSNQSYAHVGVPDAFHPRLASRRQQGVDGEARADPALSHAGVRGLHDEARRRSPTATADRCSTTRSFCTAAT